MKLAKSKIGADKFTVKVQNGVAYWEGKTNVIQHKGAADAHGQDGGAVAVVKSYPDQRGGEAEGGGRNLPGPRRAGRSVPKASVTRPKVDTAVPK